MALNTRRSAYIRNLQVDAATAQLNAGKILIYDGTQPATPETAAGATLLATFTLPNPAFGAAVNGVGTANPITDTTGVAAGTATWFRVTKADGTTPVFDGSIGTSGCNLNLTSTTVSVGGTVSIGTFTYTAPMQGA
jgi:hypothetical protein